jgi:hypothetical protein
MKKYYRRLIRMIRKYLPILFIKHFPMLGCLAEFENSKYIVVSSSLPLEQKYAVLIHEFGHFLSYCNNDKIPNAAISKAQANKPLSIKERKAVLSDEGAAWNYGIAFFDAYNFPLYNIYKIKKNCMNSYYRHTKMLLKQDARTPQSGI